jgi:hypothetical protein
MDYFVGALVVNDAMVSIALAWLFLLFFFAWIDGKGDPHRQNVQ